MYAALFEMKSWMGCEQHICAGNNACEVLETFFQVQDLYCLVQMGRAHENAAGQKALDRIEALLEKHDNGELTLDDLRSFDVKISLGGIRCACVEEGHDAIGRLREQYPSAR